MTSQTLPLERGTYYSQLGGMGLAPLWESLHALVPRASRNRASCRRSGNTRRSGRW